MKNVLHSLSRADRVVLILVALVLAWIAWRQSETIRRLESEPAVVSGEAVVVSTESTPVVEDDPAEAEWKEFPMPVPHVAVGHGNDQVSTPAGMALPPRTDGLELAETRMERAGEGLRVVMRFQPTVAGPLGTLAVVARLPPGDDSRILELDPSGPTTYRYVSRRISEDGKFAIFHGTADRAEEVVFILSLSGETVVDFRGTTGIGPYDVIVRTDGVTVQPK